MALSSARGVLVVDVVDLLDPIISNSPFTSGACLSSDAQDDICPAGKGLDSLLGRTRWSRRKLDFWDSLHTSF
ncbi:hypothetical protein CPC08DRAFT_765682 [Agrocybe pediades]|nr:hypothetical protein CPC08DRAFT_765682 [Agrocybe pediades]